MEAAYKLLGKWPVSREELDKNKKMIRITPKDWLHVIHGQENHILISFFVSNDLINVGQIVIPPAKASDMEEHKGDEGLYVLSGKLMVRIFEDDDDLSSVSNSSFEVLEGQKFLIPEGYKHQYLNCTDRLVKVLFMVAPEL